METLLALLHTAVQAILAVALVRPSSRGAVSNGLLLIGAGALIAALLGPAERTLEVTHAFAKFDGQDITLADFVVAEPEAAGWLWGTCALAFCWIWALVLRMLPGKGAQPGDGVHPFLVPMLMAWSAAALKLGIEAFAGPRGLVAPLGFERAFLPASIAAAVLMAHRYRKVLVTLAWLIIFVTVSRGPLSLFGTYATRGEWGTSLDVHRITRFANPMNNELVVVTEGSTEQLSWLIWVPNLLVMPMLYMMSLGGIAFAIVMFVTHPASATPPRPAEEQA